ncbi:ABC transporter permease [Edaphobacter dinghuensis]|uniref:Permease n=1 Tax=Edaphobacter dinghuensis TaxID=1560005 RepID=A0A917HU02_9BACT|nr:ABC transporter permease [Edaphobacter dinghuensis]GGG89242.1 hypothetical protein GCM10011585_36790 [Edaphobacter dinghuensis]
MEEDLEDELRDYFDREAERQIELGIPPEQARQQAAQELRTKELIREQCRDARGIVLVENFVRDLRYGLRVLIKSPSFFVTAVLTIALGIATSTTLFSVVESQLWRPLPFPEPQKLVVVWERNLKQEWQQTSVSTANFADWRQRAQTFQRMAAMQWPSRRRFLADHQTERVLVSAVSSGFFETLGVLPEAGTTFQPRNEEPGNQAEAILTFAFARRVFGSEQNALGKSLRLDDREYTVTGILPSTFRLDILRTPDVFVPLIVSGELPRDKRDLAVFGRLRSGTTRAAALADLESIAHVLAREYPDSDANFGVLVEDPIHAFTADATRTWLLLSLVFAFFVLLIACFNVATLQLMRSAVRSREFAVREALGANRAAMLRQAIAESAWLVTIGSVVGMILALSALQGLKALGFMHMVQRETDLSMSLWSIGFVMLTAALAALFFGLAPVLFGPRSDLEALLRGSGRSASSSPKLRRRLAALSVTQIALAFLSLFGTGLFAGSYRHLEQVTLGFDPKGIAAMQISLSGPHYTNAPPVTAFYHRALDQVSGVPGVQQAALASGLPLSGGIEVNYARADHPRPPHGQEPFAFTRNVTPGYFQLLGIPILKGRALNEGDLASGLRVAMINQNLARHLFAGENPIGKQLLLLAGDEPSIPEGRVEIVGIAGNVRDIGLNEVPFDDLYLPVSQGVPRAMYLVVKTHAFNAVAPVMRQKMQALDPEQFVAELRPLASVVREQLRGSRLNLSMVSVFAGLSLLLTAVALFGTLSFAVVQQTRDIGVRIAVGAQRMDVVKLVSRQTSSLVALGSIIGFAIAFIAGGLLGDKLFMVPHQHDGVLYGVSTRDPLSFAFAAATLVLCAGAATLLPAIRAMRIDPNLALRGE